MMRQLVPVYVLGLIVITANLEGQPVAQGAPFQVNTTTTNAQTTVDVAASGDRFVVVWENAGATDGVRISGQRLNLDGSAMGGEFTVPSSDTFEQRNPRLALTDTGAFLVQWQSFVDAGGTNAPAVRARAFSADATPAEDAFVVASEGGNSPEVLGHEVAPTAAGEFVVAVSRNHETNGYGYASVTRHLRTASGADTGNSNLTGTYRNPITPSLAGTPGGSFVVALTHTDYYATNSYFRVHRFDEDGVPAGSNFIVLADQDYYFGIGAAGVAVQPDDAFELVWSAEIGSQSDIFGLHIGSDNMSNGDPVPLNTHTTSDQVGPQVATAADGSFMAVWQSNGAPTGDTDTSGWSIRGRQLDAGGLPVGRSFQVNDITTGNQTRPMITATPDGTSFLVAWQSQSSDGGDTSSWSIRARRYSAALPLHADGFESGDLTAWDATVP